MIDPEIVNETISAFQAAEADYASNVFPRTFPRGLDTEVFTFAALHRSWGSTVQSYHREHVTPYMYEHPEIFRLASHRAPGDYSSYRWTLDTPDDLQLIRAIYSGFDNRDDFGWQEIVALMEGNSELVKLNSHVVQKVATHLMSPPSLILRADASASMGTGHVMRCLALAQAWQDCVGENTAIAFFDAAANGAARTRVRSDGFDVLALTAPSGSIEDATQVAEFATKKNAQWVVSGVGTSSTPNTIAP